MLAHARSGAAAPAEVVDDVVMSPTSASDAARLLIQLLLRGAPCGTHHLANAGWCSWRELADAVFDLAGATLRATPVSTADHPTSAKRPRFSALESETLAAFGIKPRPWREALTEYLKIKGLLAGSVG